MRNTILLIAIFIATVNLYAQNIIDPPTQQDIDYTNTAIIDRDFGKTNFILGWNWGSPGLELDEALNINYYHRGCDFGPNGNWDNQETITSSSSYTPGHRQLMQVNHVVGGYGSERYFNSQSLCLEPTLTVDTTNDFQPRPYDSSGAVFGFRYKNKVRILDETDHSDPNYHFLLLDKDSVPGNPVKVLDSIWDGRILHLLNYDPPSLNVNPNPNFNGLKWYLTINLKSRESIPSEYMDSTILTLKIEYTMDDNSTGYIKFDQVSSESINNIADIDTIYNQDRGRYKTLVSAGTPKPTELAITGEMLQFNSANDPDSLLTLSAYFVCDGIKDEQEEYISNPYLIAEGNAVEDYITNLDVEVIYHGKIDVAVRYIRLECPRAQDIFRGFYDHYVGLATDSLFDAIQGNSSGVRIHRLYGNDEVFPRCWGAMRYYNMLNDTIVGLETFTWANWGQGVHLNKPAQYLHATEFKEFDLGCPLNFKTNTAAPFIKLGNSSGSFTDPESFHYRFGYKGKYYDNPYDPPIITSTFSDYLNSEYETYLNGPGCTTLPYTTSSEYDSIYAEGRIHHNMFYGLQNSFEFQTYQSVYKYLPLIYSDKPFLANIWITSEPWVYNDDIGSYTLIENCLRPKTGEETRLMLNLPLILGVKGYLYFIKYTCDYNDGQNGIYSLGLQPKLFDYNSLTGEELVYDDVLGGDYVDMNNDVNTFFADSLDPNSLDLDSMNIDSDHVYIGVKSTRAEIYKTNNWIKSIEDDLLNLRLQAWYGKGFTELYSQHPDCSSDFLHDFIEYDNIRTKRIWNAEEGLYQSTYEDFDSSFFDVTLLKHIDDNDMDSVFFIGALNRRTDPLIYDEINETIKFFSTAEYDLGIASEDATWWKERWYKRLGCRTLKIPFNFRNSTDANDRTLLKITELGVGTDIDDGSAGGWSDPDLYHRLDTLIHRDSSIVVNFLPGEGKIFKVIVTNSKEDITGYLDYSNQRKIVAYPINQESLTDFGEMDTVRYHMVFHKPVSGFNQVFYKRSHPMVAGVPYFQIDWEDTTYCLSDNVRLFYEGTIDKSTDCDYPAIVVRYDQYDETVKAYVVYTCDYGKGTSSDIVETIFNANDVPQHVPDTGYAIESYNGIDRSQWGTPMINASRDGNYYTWSDSTEKIKAAWKRPDSTYFVGNHHKLNLSWNSPESSYWAKHPSLNSYSRYRLGEDDCALVWQEKKVSNWQIFYTRLRILEDTLRSYVTKRVDPTYDYFYYTLNSDSTIAWLNDNYSSASDDCVFPVIYRGILDTISLEPHINLEAHWDRIYWTTEPASCVYMKGIDFDDSSGTYNPDWYIAQPEFRIISGSGKSFTHVDAAQGALQATAIPWYMQYTDSVVNVNFVEFTDVSPDSTSRIWNVFHSYWGIYSGYDSLDTDIPGFKNAELIPTPGQYPQLAALPHLTEPEEIWKNRRVFEQGGSAPPIISTSLHSFFRKTLDEEIAMPFFGYMKARDKKLTSPVFLFDKYDNPLNIGINSWIRDSITCYPRDTIYSSWFKVRDIKKMAFYGMGENNTKMRMKIERRSDGRKFNVPIIYVSDTTYTEHQYELINGNDEEYRIIWEKNDDNAVYTEWLVLGGLRNLAKREDDFSPRANSYQYNNIIDLSEITYYNNQTNQIQLSLFPNSADETLYVTAYMPVSAYTETTKERSNTLSLSIYSLLGERLYQAQIKLGETIKVDVDTYPIGTYIIRAEEIIYSTALEPVSPGTERFVIER